jgi:hypothetical protein
VNFGSPDFGWAIGVPSPISNGQAKRRDRRSLRSGAFYSERVFGGLQPLCSEGVAVAGIDEGLQSAAVENAEVFDRRLDADVRERARPRGRRSRRP